MELRRPDLPYFDAAFKGPYPNASPVTAEELEEIVDGITDIAAVGQTEDPHLQVDRIQRRLDDLRVAVSRS